MKTSNEISEVFAYFRPIHLLAKCFYVTADSLRPSPKSVDRWRRRLLVTAAILFVYVVTAYMAYGDLRHLHRHSDKILMLNLDRVALAMETIVCYVVYHITYHDRNVVARLLQILDDCDRAIRLQFDEIIVHDRRLYETRKSFAYHLCCVAVLYAVDLPLDVYRYGRIQTYNVTRLFVTMIRACINYQYTAILIMAYYRMRHVNNYLNKMDVDCGIYETRRKNVSDNSKSYGDERSGRRANGRLSTVGEAFSKQRNYHHRNGGKQKSLDDIKLCRILHDAICDVCKELDGTFGAFHLFCIVTTAVEQICEAFAIFLAARDHDYGDVYGTFARGLLQLYFNLYVNFYCVFYACDLIMKESSLTKEIIQRFHLESETNHLESELRVFSMQLKHATLTFSAIEYFLLDWEMMIEINNDITSYFIFFVQYQINIDDKARKAATEMSTITSSSMIDANYTSLSSIDDWTTSTLTSNYTL